MEEERVKKGAKGKPSTSLSYSGSESESDEMKMAVDSKNEDKSSAAENTAKDDGQEEVEEEEEEEEEEESDEEEEDDEEEEEESDDDDDDIGVNKKRSKKIAILESESSDDGEGDDCPICLNRLKYQDIGTPEACDHNFCLDCIQLWARNVNTCPVDRREFQLILARHAKEDEIFKRIPVSGKSLQNEDDDTDVNEDFTYCELCGRSDREDRLLLCDGCDLGFHCECLDPPLDSVPVEEWFCPDCAEANTQRSSRMLNDLDDMQYLLEENSIDGIPYLRPRRRQIARTRISERVRARIQEYREGLARLVCDDEPGASDEEGEGPSTRLSRTRSQTRQSEAKRKPPRRKRTKKGRAGKQKAYPKKKLRRRTKAPGKAQLFDKLRNANTSKSPKSRLAGKLGLTKARTSLRKSDRVTAAQIVKEDLYGPKPLTITGGKHDLDPFPDDDSYNRSDEPQASTSVFSAAAAKRASKYSASALLSRQPVARPLLCKLPEDNPGSNFFSGHCSNSGGSNAASSSGGGLDLLGSIMMDQNILNLESKDVKINRDGSLTAKKAVTASAVKEPKNKKFHLFIDSKDDENSSVHMDSDNERSSDDSKVAASTGCPSSERNNDSSSQVEDDKKENSDPKEEPMESDTDLKCSDAEMRDSDNETKPSTIESGNEMSVPANQDDDDDEDQEDEGQAEKKDDEDVEDSFESNEADKSVEKENEDGSSHDGLTEVGLDSQNSEMNDENVSPEKESIDQANNSEEEGEKGCEVRNNMEEEDVGDEDEEICKDEQKDDVSEHEGEEENDEEQQEDKAASERGSSGFSPVEKSSDADPHSDVEPASFQKEEEEFLSDEENGGKDASMSVEKMDDSAEISESVHDEQRAASDADDTEDDVTGKEDEDSVKSDAEEASKDVDEADPKSDAEAKDTEMVKSDAEELDAEMTAKSDAEELDAEMTAQSDAEELDAEMTAKSDAENLNPEMTVKSDDEDLDPGLAAKSDAGDLDPEVAVKSDDDDLEPEVAVKSDDDDLEREAAVKSDDDDLEPEVAVKSDGDDDDLEPEVAVKSDDDDDDDLEPEVAVKSDDDDLEPEMAVKSDAEDLEPETAVKSDDDDLEPETAVKSDDDDLEPEMAAKSDAEDLEPETAVKSDDDDLEPETAAKSDAEDLEPETAAKSDAEDFEPETAVKSDADDLEPGMFKSDTDDLEPGMFKSDTDDLDLETAIKSDPEDLEPEMMFKSDTDDLDPEMMVKSDADDLDTEEPENEASLLVKSDQEEEDVQEETEVSEDVSKFVPEDDDNSPETMQDDMLPSESDRTEEQEFSKVEESDDNGENLATENLADQIYEDKDGKLEVADEASENFDDAASKDSDGMVKTHEELETFEEQNEVCDEVGSESEMESAGNEEEEEEEEDELQEKPKIPISELPRIPKRSRREGYRRERGSKGDGPELKSVLGRVDLPEYKMGRTWEKKDSRRNRWDPDEWSQSERDIDCAGNRDKKSEGSKGYHSDHSESSKGSSEKYTFEYKESKSRKRRRDRSRSRSRGHKDSIVEYRDIPHRRHSPERSKSRRRDRSRNRSRSGSREKSFDYDKSHKRKSRGRSRDRSQSRKSRRHRSYSRSPSRKRDKERSSTDKRRHREERKRGEERSHKRHSDKSDPEESRKKRHIHEDYDEWEDGSCQVVEFDESTSPKGAAGKKSAGCFYGSPSSNEKVNENFFNRRTLHEKGAFKGDKMDESAFYNARGSNKKHKFVDRFYKAPHLRHTGTEKFPIDLSEEDEGDEHTGRSRSSRLDDSGRERDTAGQDSGDSEYDPAFPTESGSPLRGRANREGRKPPEESSAPVAVTTAAPTLKTSAAAVKTTSAAAEEIASSGSVDETPPTGSQGILGESGFMMSENPNMQNMPMQPQNLSFPMGIRMMPPGMQPGMQQHLLMNPMFLNRPPPFGRLPRMSGPMGRLGWSVNPSGIMQIPPNRFGHARMGPGGGMPPRPGLLNGGFEGMSQEPGQQMPPFKQHPCDPRNIPSHTAGHQGPPGQIPRHHMPHLPPHGPLLPHPPPPPPSSQQMHIPPPTSDTLSSSSLDSHLQHGLGKGQPSSDEKSASSNFCVPELNQISKLIEAHAQALQNKQRNPASQGSDIDVFKIPLPPMAPPSIPPPTMGLPIVPPLETHTYTSTSKSYKNGQSRLLANSHSLTELVSESTEVVDMDVASPLDDEVAIELPASPELDDIDESKINMKDSAVIELTVPEDMPASAVELTNLTNKEKHTSRVKKSNPKASQQRTASPTSTKTSYMGYMKKLQIQERVVDEVKLAIKPFYSGKKIDKDEYKEILRKAVPKICHSKSGNINPAKIKALIEAYVDKMCKTRRYMERKKKLSLKANGERLKKPSR